MSDGANHQPGDIVNGHILGADMKWHPVADAAPEPPPQPGSPTQARPPVAADPGAQPSDSAGTPAAGATGLSRGAKVGLVAGAGALLLAGLATAGFVMSGASGSESAKAAASSSPVDGQSISTYWSSLPASEQSYRCDGYRTSTHSNTTVQYLVGKTSSSASQISAFMEGECPAPKPTAKPTPTAVPTPAQPAAPKTYAALDERTWQLIAKDPSKYAGQTFLVFGEVTQFDSATGTSAFRADVAHANTCSYTFFDGDNTVLLAGPGTDLSNVVKDDIFAAQVTVLGAYTYETAIGGSATVPKLQVDSIEVQGRCG